MRDAEGKATGLNWFIRDMTEPRKTEQDLRAANELLEKFFCTEHVLVAHLDTDFNFIRVNRAYASADKRVPEFYPGKNHFAVFPNKENEAIFRRVVETGEPYSAYAKPFEYAEHPERGITYWDWMLLPINEGAGKIEGLLLCLINVTDRVRAEEDLKKYQDHLEDLVQARTAELKEANRKLQAEIEERKRADDALLESEQKYRELFEDSIVGIFTVDLEGRYTSCNPAALKVLGCSLDEIIGKSYQEHVTPESIELVSGNYNRVFQTGRPVQNIRYDIITKAGERKTIECNVSAMMGGGRVIGFQGAATDVTIRKHDEDNLRNALEESRKRAAETFALLESSRAVLEYLDFEQAARAIFNSCKNLIGARSGYVSLLNKDATQNEAVFLNPGDLECTVDRGLSMPVRGLRAEAYRSGNVVYENRFAESEWTSLLPAGHMRLENVLFAPLLIGGSAVGLIGLGNKPGGFTDSDARLAAAFAGHAAIAFRNSRYIDAVRKSEARYRRLSESLEEMVKNKVAELKQAETLASIGRMVSTVAHEVRNPLQNIQLGLDAIRQHIGNDKDKAEILDEIAYGANSLNRIVNELLEYGKPLSLECSPCSVREIIQHALNSMAHKLNNINVRIELEDENREILLDADKICRVLLNLIANAIEAMPGGGNLIIRSQFAGEACSPVLKLCVSDSGCGIPQEYISHVFEPFFTTKTWGTGLGSSICKRIVEAHNGKLDIESRINEGTTVKIALPVGVPR